MLQVNFSNDKIAVHGTTKDAMDFMMEVVQMKNYLEPGALVVTMLEDKEFTAKFIFVVHTLSRHPQLGEVGALLKALFKMEIALAKSEGYVQDVDTMLRLYEIWASVMDEDPELFTHNMN